MSKQLGIKFFAGLFQHYVILTPQEVGIHISDEIHAELDTACAEFEKSIKAEIARQIRGAIEEHAAQPGHTNYRPPQPRPLTKEEAKRLGKALMQQFHELNREQFEEPELVTADEDRARKLKVAQERLYAHGDMRERMNHDRILVAERERKAKDTGKGHA